jgi:hypothetical protein
MATHVKVVGVIFIVLGGLWILGALFSTVVLSVIASIISTSDDPNAGVGVAVLGLTGATLSMILLAFGIPQVLCGWGLLSFRPWARIVAIILAAISLTYPPIGTLFGIYALVILFRKDTEALFTA